LACLSAGIGCFVFFYDMKKISNICFLILTVISGLWIVSFSTQNSIYPGFSKDYFTGDIMLFFGEFISLVFLFFIFTFTKKDLKVSGKFLSFIFIPFSLVVALLYIFPTLIVKPEIIFPGFEPGPLFFLYVLSVLENVLTGVYLLVKRFKESAGIFKTTARAMLVIIFCGAIFLSASFFGYYHFEQKELFLLFVYVFLVMTYFLIGFNVLQFSRLNTQTFITETFILLISMILVVEIVFVKSPFEIVVDILILFFFIFSGYYLIKSVGNESMAKEEIEKLVKDLVRVHEELQSLDKRKSEFVKISAVRLKDPLTAIKGYSSMLLEGSFGGKINSEAFSAIEKIYEASEWLVNIIKDFMDITNIETGKMEYTFADTDIKKIVKQVIESQAVSIKKSGLDVTFDTDRSPRYTACVDAGKIRQVISNILDNSLKYTPKGSVYIFLKKEKEPNRIHLTITDTGVGIAPDMIDKLFEKFIRADEANKQNTGGSGLGLYVAKEIVKKHGGKIWVESPGLGNGSTFHIEFFEKEESEGADPSDQKKK
jgi:signal transduction histidine kinase